MVTYRKFKAGNRFAFIVEGEISVGSRGRTQRYERQFRKEKDALANARMWNGIEKTAAHDREADRLRRVEEARGYLAERARRAVEDRQLSLL